MGLMNKLTPKKTTAKKHVEASHEAPTIVSKGKVAPAGVAPAGVLPAGHGDDESTVFTTFMILYYGFFGITLLVYPRLHCADGPFPNPLAYWTTISDETEFVFRLAGTAILTLVIGPFLDEPDQEMIWNSRLNGRLMSGCIFEESLAGVWGVYHRRA